MKMATETWSRRFKSLVGPNAVALGLIAACAAATGVWFAAIPYPLNVIVLVGGVCVAGWILLIVTRTELAVLLLVVLFASITTVELPFDVPYRVSLDIILVSALIPAGLARLLDLWLIQRHRMTTAAATPTLLFLIISLLATVSGSPDLLLGITNWFRYLSYYILFLLILATFRTREQIVRLVKAFLFSAVVPIAVGFYQLLVSPTIYRIEGIPYEYNRIRGTTGGPYTFAYYLLLVVVVSMVFYPQFSRWMRRYVLILILAAGTALTSTYIRGAWFALAVVLLAIGCLRDRRYLILLPALIVVPLVVPSVGARLQMLTHQSATIHGRIRIWQLALQQARRYWLLGHGLLGFELEYGLYFHNEYLHFLVDTGVAGLGLLAAQFAIVAHKAIGLARTAHHRSLQRLGWCYLFVMLGVLVGCVGDHLLSQPGVAMYVWVLTAAVVAGERSISRNRHSVGDDHESWTETQDLDDRSGAL